MDSDPNFITTIPPFSLSPATGPSTSLLRTGIFRAKRPAQTNRPTQCVLLTPRHSFCAWGIDLVYPIGNNGVVFTVRQTEEFVAWLDGLGDQRAQIRIIARLRQAEAGNLGDWQPVEGEVSEMRVNYGPGYRLYFVRRGRFIVIMLNAGDKSSQNRDVRRALKLATQIGED